MWAGGAHCEPHIARWAPVRSRRILITVGLSDSSLTSPLPACRFYCLLEISTRVIFWPDELKISKLKSASLSLLFLLWSFLFL